MADGTGATENATWPMPSSSFLVTIGEQQNIPFQEVTGLEGETQVIEYRHSNSKQYSAIKMPGIAKFSNVTLKKGVFVNGNSFWTWYEKITMNTIGRLSVVIQLLDEKSKPMMVWTLNNAWPTKVTGPDLKSEGNEIAINTIELAHEGLTIANPSS
jgi:phage tail-like protein